MPAASIVIRSMNDLRYIERTMEMIRNQDFQDFELINVDSGSTDGTFEVVKKYNPDAWQIPPGSYIPGRVLNDAIARCHGEYIVFNNSDCIPMHRQWLQNLLKPLQENADVAAVFGQQLCRPDARPLVCKDGERAYGDGRVSRRWHHFFSLATSAARRDLLLRYPFDPEIRYSEDVEWSYRMKQLGHTIVYVPEAMVEHSHNYTLREVWKRFYNEGLAEGRIYGGKPGFWNGFLRPWLGEVLRDWVYLLKHGQLVHLPYGLIYRFRQKYAVYRGRRDYRPPTESEVKHG